MDTPAPRKEGISLFSRATPLAHGLQSQSVAASHFVFFKGKMLYRRNPRGSAMDRT